MSVNQGVVGLQRNPDSPDPVAAKFGNQGETLTGGMNGFFFEQCLRGNGYVFSTALAGNALVAATTTNAPAILNPPGQAQPRVFVVWKITYNRTAVGTPLEGGIVYCKTQVKSVLGTGADIVSGTPVAGQNLRLDLPDASGMLFYPTTIATTPTPSYFANAGLSQNAAAGTTTQPTTFNDVDRVDGMILIPPGVLFSVAAQVSLSTTYAISIFGMSLPFPLIATP